MRSVKFGWIVKLRDSLRSLSDNDIEQVRDISAFSSKLGRTEEVGRQGTARVLGTLRLHRTTAIEDVQIKLQSFLLGIALEKIKILLTDEEVSAVDRIRVATPFRCNCYVLHSDCVRPRTLSIVMHSVNNQVKRNVQR